MKISDGGVSTYVVWTKMALPFRVRLALVEPVPKNTILGYSSEPIFDGRLCAAFNSFSESLKPER